TANQLLAAELQQAALSTQIEGDQRAVARRFVPGLPGDFAGELVKSHDRSLSAHFREHPIFFDEWRPGKPPCRRFRAEILLEILRPFDHAIGGREAEEIPLPAYSIDEIAINGRSATGAQITIRVLRGAGILVFPVHFSAFGIETKDIIVLCHIAHCIKPAFADGRGRVADSHAGVPELLWTAR